MIDLKFMTVLDKSVTNFDLYPAIKDNRTVAKDDLLANRPAPSFGKT
jgi:hypothetical protein